MRTVQFRPYLVQSGDQPLFDVEAIAQEQSQCVIHFFVTFDGFQVGDGRRTTKLRGTQRFIGYTINVK